MDSPGGTTVEDMVEEIFTELTGYLSQMEWAGLVLTAIAGLAVAFSGYRIRLIFFFVIGFYVTAAVIGPTFASIIEAPETALVIGAIAGVIGGFVAVRLYFVALFLLGLLIGASLFVTFAGSLFAGSDTAIIVAAAIGGLAGGAGAIVLDRTAVVLGSALAGALHAAAAGSTMFFRAVAMNETAWFTIFAIMLVIIAAAGILFQLRAFPRSRYRYDKRRARRA